MHEGLMKQALLESAIPMGLVDRSGAFRQVNSALCEMVGYAAEELCTMTWQDLSSPGDIARMDVLLQQVLNGGIDHFETRLRLLRLDGSSRLTRCTVSAVPDPSGTPELLCLQALDVTEETLLDETVALLAAQGTDVLARGSNDGIITWVSPNVRNMTGWRPEQLQGTPFLSIIHPDDRPLVAATQQSVLQGRGALMSVRLMSPDGHFTVLAIQVDPVFGPSGEVTGRVATWRRERPN